MLFNMPGPDIVPAEGKTNPQFVYDAFSQTTPAFTHDGTAYAVYQMGDLLTKMIFAMRQTPQGNP